MYKIVKSSGNQTIIALQQNGVLLSFTENPDNTDYQAYLEWLEAGNEPEVVE
jgi:hypothetical protein